MRSYLVVFDQGSEALIEELDLIATEALLPLKNKNVWVVNSAWDTARQLAKHLKGFGLPSREGLNVMSLSGGFGECGLTDEAIDWLRDKLLVR